MRRNSYKWLPSRSVGISLVLVGVLITGSAWYTTYGHNLFALNTESIPESGSVERVLDSDNDGLKDWEETLWNTDPNLPDSDNDGMSDGEEVSLGTAPNGEESSSLVNEIMATSSEFVASASSPLTPTDQFSRLFFKHFIESQNTQDPSGRFSDPREIEILIAEADTIRNKPPKYTRSDILIVPDVTPKELRVYGNAVSHAYAIHTKPGAEAEFVVLNRALVTNNKADFAKLADAADMYWNGAQELLKLPAPESLAGFQLAIINSTVGLSYAIRDLSVMPDDPLRGVLGLRSYYERFQSLVSSISAMSRYFAAFNIHFSPTEDGYMFEILKIK